MFIDSTVIVTDLGRFIFSYDKRWNNFGIEPSVYMFEEEFDIYNWLVNLKYFSNL